MKQTKRPTRAEKVAPPPLPDSFESPESSVIAGARYDAASMTLTVDIRKGPNVTQEYVYSNVKADVWAEFVTAESKGKYFSAAIRPMFAGRAV